MNEPFAIEVRRHLLDTADERPADGQLDTVLRLTALERQQRPWFVRLRWLLSPVAPFANGWLRYAVVVALLVIAAAFVAVMAGGSSPPGRTVFEGTWVSTDPADDSAQTLVVGGGLTPSVHFEDAFSIMCSINGDTTTLFLMDGTGQIQFERMIVDYGPGGCVTWRVDPSRAFLMYDGPTDTLVDQDGLSWHRAP